jgi:hypothetical protein
MESAQPTNETPVRRLPQGLAGLLCPPPPPAQVCPLDFNGAAVADPVAQTACVAPTSGLAGDVKPKDLALAINRAAASGGRSYRSAGNSAKVKVPNPPTLPLSTTTHHHHHRSTTTNHRCPRETRDSPASLDQHSKWLPVATCLQERFTVQCTQRAPAQARARAGVVASKRPCSTAAAAPTELESATVGSCSLSPPQLAAIGRLDYLSKEWRGARVGRCTPTTAGKSIEIIKELPPRFRHSADVTVRELKACVQATGKKRKAALLDAAPLGAVADCSHHAATDFQKIAVEAIDGVALTTMLDRAVIRYASLSGGGNKKTRAATPSMAAGLRAEPTLLSRALAECGLLTEQIGAAGLAHNESLYVSPASQHLAATFDGASPGMRNTAEVKFEAGALGLPTGAAARVLGPNNLPGLMAECAAAAAGGGAAVIAHMGDGAAALSFTLLVGASSMFDVTVAADQGTAGVGWSLARGRHQSEEAVINLDEPSSSPPGSKRLVGNATFADSDVHAAMWCASAAKSANSKALWHTAAAVEALGGEDGAPRG